MIAIANIKDVAQKANVSISTVSRVLNNTKPVSSELSNKVHDAVKQLDYQVNSAARELRIAQTKRIAIILTSLSRSFFPSVLEGIHKEAEKLGYSLLIAETHDTLQKEAQLVDLLVSQRVDGIILASSAYDDDAETLRHIERLDKLHKKGSPIPVVTLEFPLNNPRLGAVVIDHEQAAYDAVHYLIHEIGCEQIIHISHPERHYIGQKRIDGYRRAMRDANFPEDRCRIVNGNYSTYSGYNLTCQLLKDGVACDAFFCANDQLAVGAIKACEEAGIRIPEQIAIVGVDDIFAASIVSPALTSVHVPKKEMGASAMLLLHELIVNGYGPERQIITLDYKLIERQTSRKDAVVSLKIIEW